MNAGLKHRLFRILTQGLLGSVAGNQSDDTKDSGLDRTQKLGAVC